jgi:outer membrane protein insertion porin family/translocation and assembly module TamA
VGDILIRIEQDSSKAGEPPAISEATVRRLLGFKEGDLVSARKLLEAQRNLFQTDAYRTVQIRPAADSVQPAGDSLMVIQAFLVEGAIHDLRVGVGWGTLDCFRTQATYTDRSFLGDARLLQVTGRVSKIGIGHPLDGAENLCRKEARDDLYSDTLSYRAAITLRQPGFLGLGARNAPSLTVYSEQRSEYLAYFRTVPLGLSASISRDFTPNARLALPATFTYTLEYGGTQAQPAIYCALFNLCGEEERDRVGRRERLAVASLSVVRDGRDYVLDPTRGFAAQVEWRHASRAILSEASLQFNTVIGDYRRYWSLGSDIVLSARLRAGAVLGQQLRLQIAKESGGVQEVAVRGYIPPAERLYSGGPSTVRGFRFNELGPEVYIVNAYDTVASGLGGDTVYFRARDAARVERSVPTGGNSMVVGNVELRVPSLFFRDLLTFAFFVDAGEVWNRGSSVGAAQARFDGIKITPGMGVRVFSPVGPIRVDVGYNPYDRGASVAYFDAPVGEGGVAPLYCVSPGNTLKVVPGGAGRPFAQLSGSGTCGSSFLPEGRAGLRRLTFNFSIGQAF